MEGECLVKKQGHECAKYIGSAISGLGFYYIEVFDEGEAQNIDFTNCGIIIIESGEITKKELEMS